MDHKPAPQFPLIKLVLFVAQKMSENKNLSVFIHCRAGKGRTGTFVSCLLILFGLVNNVEEAQNLFRQKRYVTVEREFQLKNIIYFESFLKQERKYERRICGLKFL
jgi:protein-tyrosine phosphatase